jgi:hypothetical protein
MRSGLTLVPTSPLSGNGTYRVSLPADRLPVMQLHETLADIGRRYGVATRELVKLELEYGTQDGF